MNFIEVAEGSESGLVSKRNVNHPVMHCRDGCGFLLASGGHEKTNILTPECSARSLGTCSIPERFLLHREVPEASRDSKEEGIVCFESLYIYNRDIWIRRST
jgi:hypothetical protein